MSYSADPDVFEVFSTVLTTLGTYARDTWEGSAGGVGNGAGDAGVPALDFPFVCERGYVNAGFGVPAQVGWMRHHVLYCADHTYGENKCKRHPVVEPGILAAFQLGGPEAVRTTRELQIRGRFDKQVWQLWSSIVGKFRDAVVEYDRALEANEQAGAPGWPHGRNVQLAAVPVGKSFIGGEVQLVGQTITVQIRPGARRRSRKKGL